LVIGRYASPWVGLEFHISRQERRRVIAGGAAVSGGDITNIVQPLFEYLLESLPDQIAKVLSDVFGFFCPVSRTK
jgi:hypothetical protein